MKRRQAVDFEFVDVIPESLDGGKVYISIPHATALHSCLCGCGEEVVTPISPVWWTLSFDGKSISLDPSIGSWQLKCHSHYWITRNQVEWAPAWTGERIRRQQSADRSRRQDYFRSTDQAVMNQIPKPASAKGFWQTLPRVIHNMAERCHLISEHPKKASR